jgi:hypothetical protein
LPLSARARIEVFLPDSPRPAYQDLLVGLEREFSYVFGGCSTLRGFKGSYLARNGDIIRDCINLVFTDAPFGLDEHLDVLARYADEIRNAAEIALDE